MADDLEELLKGLENDNRAPDIVEKKVETKPIPTPVSIGPEFAINPYFRVKIKNSKLSEQTVQRYVGDREKLRLNDIFQLSHLPADWVTVGVLVEKQPTRQSKTGSPYLMWRISDLLNCNKSIRLLLFGPAARDLWKLPVGCVFALLSPNRLENEDDKAKDKSSVALKLDHPEMLLELGTSADLSFCRGTQKSDGQPCRNFINRDVSDWCDYHILRAGKRATASRGELQNPFNSAPKSFERKLFGSSSEIIHYGGESFGPKTSKTLNVKNRQTSALAQASVASKPPVKSFSDLMPAISSTALLKGVASTNSLASRVDDKSSLGVRDFIRHHLVSPATPKLSPKPTPSIDLEIGQKSVQKKDVPSAANRRAAQMILKKGPIEKKDPNAFGSTKRRYSSVEERPAVASPKSISSEPLPKRGKFGDMNISAEEFNAILKSHEQDSNEVDAEQMERYFNSLEGVEKMENRLSEIKEFKDCSVVSCTQCKYTSHRQSDYCKTQGHKVAFSKASKRFFACQDCSKKTFCFSLHPTKPCYSCGSTKFTRTTFKEERVVTSLTKLELRGKEQKFINS